MSDDFFTDSHAHLTSSDLFEEVDAIVARAKETNIQRIVNICTDADSLHSGLQLHQKYPWIHNAAAVHPHDVEKEGERFFDQVEKAASEKKIIAVGETGLDYFYMHSAKDIQRQFLKKHLQLALRLQLPAIIHCRDAFEDFFQIFDEIYHTQTTPTVLHCFTGTKEEALQALERGLHISFSGIITFKKSEPLREVVKIVPLDRMFIETDAPYLAPQSKRGKRNEPSYVPEVADTIAKIKNISVAEVAKATTHNAKTFFGIDSN